MRRILIISEEDLAGQRLNQLYNSLFTQEKKELYWCSIDIVDCRQESVLYPHKINITPTIKNVPHNYESYLTKSRGAIKTIRANNCQEINDLIKKYKIDTVLIPNFIYDEHRAKQYRTIVKDIKRKNRIEIIGLYI